MGTNEKGIDERQENNFITLFFQLCFILKRKSFIKLIRLGE